MVNTTLKELGLHAEISRISVDTDLKAKELRFLGSPSIRVNGKDIESGADKRLDYGMQ